MEGEDKTLAEQLLQARQELQLANFRNELLTERLEDVTRETWRLRSRIEQLEADSVKELFS